MTTDAISAEDLAIDHELAQLGESFRFLLDVTPVDVESARADFLGGAMTEPRFTYRDLEADPDVLAAILASIDVAAVEDTTLGHLLRAKHREIELQLEMLRTRCTDEFHTLSIELYGAVAPRLLEQAEALLARVPDSTRRRASRHVPATEFVELAEVELAHYRTIDPDIGVHVELRPDVAGVMVSGSVLLVSPAATIRSDRVEALLQHEVGTHLVTHVNGSFQPVRVMATGLAGYEATQEGLAVFAEFLVGGLSTFRLRQLAGRVVAVHQMTAGASFADVHNGLVQAGFSPGTAFTMSMRVFRAGGLTKDAIYLRGLLDVLDHVSRGGDLEPLWLGKFALQDLPLVAELSARGVLVAPKLRPRYADDPDTLARLRHAAGLTDVAQLAGESL
jgi:uncharacterized protein (TIGR02421 family)